MVALNEQVAAGEIVPTVIEVTKSIADIIPVSDEDLEKAQKNFVQGKKFLLLNKFDEAVSNFDDSCKIFSRKYGELNIECADLYFFYGKALLELARVENTVLGNALNGIPDDSQVQINDSRYGNPDEVEDKERETISEKVIDAMCEGGEEKKDEVVEQQQEQVRQEVVEPAVVKENVNDVVVPKNDEAIKPVEDVVAIEGQVVVDGEAGVEGEVDEDDEDDEEGDEEVEDVEGEAENEDISNLQRSWEMFELAKVVFQKQTDVATFKRRIAECLLKLGEISIEQELYEQAIVDITESIRLQEEEQVAVRDERLLAETYYQIGLAQQFNNQFKIALDSYQRSINILQIRIDKLKHELVTVDNKQPVQDEISELEAILPEILGKIDECNEQDQQTVNLVKECFINKINGAANGVSNGAEAAEVRDITSLVKSKRKLSASSEHDLKKTKFEDSENVEEKVDVETPIVN